MAFCCRRGSNHYSRLWKIYLLRISMIQVNCKFKNTSFEALRFFSVLCILLYLLILCHVLPVCNGYVAYAEKTDIFKQKKEINNKFLYTTPKDEVCELIFAHCLLVLHIFKIKNDFFYCTLNCN